MTQARELVELSLDPDTLLRQLWQMENAPQDMYVILPGVSRFYTQGVVLRYMLMFDTGTRSGFASARQGLFTIPTLAQANVRLESLLTSDTADRIKELYGSAKALFVGFTACYGGHYDPAPIDLGGSPRYPRQPDGSPHDPGAGAGDRSGPERARSAGLTFSFRQCASAADGPVGVLPRSAGRASFLKGVHV